MKENNKYEIGEFIGFYSIDGILQIANILGIDKDEEFVITNSDEKIYFKNIVDVGFVDLNKYDQLQSRIKELESAERTLINLGYKNSCGEFWKPPVGKIPDFSLIDRLNERIADLGFENKKVFELGKKAFNQLLEVEKQRNELAQKIRGLESEKHINEIKSQGVEKAIYYTCSKLSEVDNLGDIDQADEHFLLEYTENLRGNHE